MLVSYSVFPSLFHVCGAVLVTRLLPPVLILLLLSPDPPAGERRRRRRTVSLRGASQPRAQKGRGRAAAWVCVVGGTAHVCVSALRHARTADVRPCRCVKLRTSVKVHMRCVFSLAYIPAPLPPGPPFPSLAANSCSSLRLQLAPPLPCEVLPDFPPPWPRHK